MYSQKGYSGSRTHTERWSIWKVDPINGEINEVFGNARSSNKVDWQLFGKPNKLIWAPKSQKFYAYGVYRKEGFGRSTGLSLVSGSLINDTWSWKVEETWSGPTQPCCNPPYGYHMSFINEIKESNTVLAGGLYEPS